MSENKFIRGAKMKGKKLSFQDFMHVGLIVKNIEQTLEKMENIFEIGPYKIIEFPPKEMKKDEIQLSYHGKSTWFTARFCFIKMGNTEIELIEPVEGDSIWKDFLAEKGEGIHHLKYEVDSLNDTIEFFKTLGVNCPQYGSAVGVNLGKTWAYFVTTVQLGYIVEILNRQKGEIVKL
jgi:catechol 2,3-dioxygenase-like lactoylglutathione lyase family enzyme